jgi:CRP-like cAMP-binding protein
MGDTAHGHELADLPLLAGPSAAELGRVSRSMTPVHVEAGAVLTTEGQPGREAMLVVRGQAVVTRGGEEVAVVGPGELIGEIAVLDGGLRSATVVARTPMDLEVLAVRDFLGALAERPDIARRVMALLAGRARG